MLRALESRGKAKERRMKATERPACEAKEQRSERLRRASGSGAGKSGGAEG
jgi:hypothetical protein